jgi:hypothetical protein
VDGAEAGRGGDLGVRGRAGGLELLRIAGHRAEPKILSMKRKRLMKSR